MKAISVSLTLLCVVLCGCASPPSVTKETIGRNFDETKVSQVKKGVTTAEGVVTLFGEPDAKQFVSANELVWHYTYISEAQTEDRGDYMPKLTQIAGYHPFVKRTTGFKKNLDLLLQDGTVVNFAYVKAPRLVLCGWVDTAKQTISGRDFEKPTFVQIQKGVTTADGIASFYGEPDSKEIVSANQVMWHYTYLNELHTTNEMFMSIVEDTAGVKKNLDILFQDDTVINFSYSKDPIQSEKTN